MPWWDLGSLSRLKNFSGLFQDVSSKKPEISAVNSDSFTPIDLPLIGHREDENKMQEVQLGSHTVRSHGMTVARTHMHDWVILMLLGLIVVILNVIHPFYRFVGKDMMTDLKYPLKSNTVPVWAIPMYAVALPIAIFFIVYFRRRDVYDLHHAILGLLFSVLITGVITDAIKDAVGRPRPDFFWRCFPDGKDVYDQLGNVVCHGKKSVIKEGHKSFPSGHTSYDYWHHWQDVFAGGLLGFIVASFCYLQFFPPPYHAQGWGPYAYFQVLEESRSVTQAATIVNGSNVQVTEARVENQEDETSIHGCMGLSLAHNSGSALEELESGRR
ncbi:putative lipid phosphate phosphatase 3, chloroplastic isoform X3 [Prunus persica]|uniref:putative lipid phosphate phosphatase 3, chloroplastic isoform X3 n=1 Tax=Prunus persica TaxID=3760 RepID=UPI0009AB5F58|nr:putative lipid phosphate phosphatase 3, chloroplastic isoform X3 [Prunus persica]